MKKMKRVLSLLLCTTMLLGILPVGTFAATGGEDTEYLFLATDRHGDTDIIGKLLTKMENVVGDNVIDYVGLAGDMVDNTNSYKSSTILSEVTTVASNMNANTVDLTMANHDSGCDDDAGIMNETSGVWYTGTNYYVYGVIETDVKNPTSAESAAAAFQEWAESLSDNKVIVVNSHFPIHAKRGDNNGAGYWHKALNAVATDDSGNVIKDVMFFHGHNHTTDTEEYYYSVGESMSIENLNSSSTSSYVNGTNDTIYYTYATSGYLTEERGNGQATLLAISGENITVNKYSSSSYSVLGTVTRVVNDEVITLDTLSVTGNTNYYVGDSVQDPSSAVVTYSDGTNKDLNASDLTCVITDSEGTVQNSTTFNNAGTYYLSYSYTEDDQSVTATLEVIVNEVTNSMEAISLDTDSTTVYTVGDDLIFTKVVLSYYDANGNICQKDLTTDECTLSVVDVATGKSVTADNAMANVGTYQVTASYTLNDKIVSSSEYFDVCASENLTSEAENVVVSVSSSVVGSITAVNSTNENVDDAVVNVLKSGYVAYDITPEIALKAGNYATITLPIPEGVTNPVVYYVSDDGATVTNMNATNNGDNTVSFTTDHFSIYVVGDAAEEDEKDLTLGGTTTTTRTVYVLTSNISTGSSYLIVNGNDAGGYYALANNSGSVAATGVTVKTGDIDNDGSSETYIELTDATDEMWTVGSGYTFKNGSYYLYPRTKNNGSLELDTSSRNWSYSSNRLSYKKDNTNYYLYYSNGWDISTTQNNVYFYVPTEVEVEVDSSIYYNVSASDIKHIYDSDDTTVETEELTYDLLANGKEVSFDGQVWTVKVVSDPNGIIDTTNSTNETLYFTGKTGTATMRVYYQLDANGDGDVTDDDDYKVWNTFTVTATYPYYTVDITHNSDGTGAEGTTSDYVSVEDTIVIKGVEPNDIYDLWAKVYQNGTGDAIIVDSSKLTWSSNNTSVATVDTNGNVTFTGNDGTVQITVYYEYTDNDGNKVKAPDVVTFSVSKNQYTIPADGTNDFPEYPNQGAIRFDKTATAVGNFSQTGIAQVELSMTGVPYGTSTKTDVVIMVDMTASMSDDDVTAAESAVKELIESLVYDEENDKYDSNIQLFVDVFYSASSDSSFETDEYLNNVTISDASELTAAKNTIDFTQSSNGGGTRYNLAMKDVYETLTRTGHADNQFVVFVSDGVPTAYAPASFDTDGTVSLGTTITGNNSETASLADGWFNLTTGAVTDSFETEYYSYMIKTAGIPIYTVGCNLTALTEPAEVLAHMSSNYSADGKTSTGETKYSFFCTTSGGITDEVLEIFSGIGQDIKEAAKNVVVEDKIADEYTMTFSLPSGVTAEEADMDDFYIQVLGYELDDNNERKDTPEVLEKFLFNSDGSITHTIGSTTCGDTCTHVTYTNGVVTSIDGTYFDYSSTDDGELLTWTAEKLDRTELALQYFVYLDNSAGDVAAADQVDAGTYSTNEYATITYTNFNGNECQQYFPVPSMTWKGAKVTYVFYLVNEKGQPVNRAGKVIPFAEAVYVTDPFTHDVTWNEETGSENMLAENLFASANVPDVYELYDNDAAYVIRVYQTETIDTNGKDGNYFQITGATDKLIDSEIDNDTTADNSTTKVFNTKAGTKYDQYGIYSSYDVGTSLTNGENDITTNFKTTDIDYANTTVAFAVVWKPELVEDTVVIDYGLDVVIDVTTNDAMAAGVSGVSLTPPTDVEINKWPYPDAKKVGSDSITSDDGIWTASKESLTSVRFHLNNMELSAPAKFYYEAGVNYYTYDASNNATLNTTNMYSSVTVIPATTIYYEDEYATLKTYTKKDDGSYLEEAGWIVNSEHVTAVQDQDRPGENKISETLDADNNYGYDSAYGSMSKYSMGSAAKTIVDENTYATAEFEFYGTGFDVISMTDTTTGSIVVDVFAWDTTTNAYATAATKSFFVDTYYGYTYGDSDNDGDDEWYTVNTNDPNALYQVPVIQIEDLTYGKYKVVITAVYADLFDNTDAGSYSFYLDAIRIYDPITLDTVVGKDNEEKDVTVESIYSQDGEGWPVYQELRTNVIAASNFTTESAELNGIVFVDSNAETMSVADYVSYGPNNELYLDEGQAIIFSLDLSTYGDIVDSVQIGMKAVDSTGAKYVIMDGADITNSEDLTGADTTALNTSTDMYYDITDLKDSVIVIYNTKGMLSLTDIKITFTKDPGNVDTLYYVDYDVISAVLEGANTDPTFEPTIEVEVSAETVTKGGYVSVTVTTSSDVETVSIDGNLVTTYTVDNSGNRIWKADVTCDEAGKKTISVIAYNAKGVASEAKNVIVTVNNPSVQQVVKEAVQNAIRNLWNSFKSWFKWG